MSASTSESELLVRENETLRRRVAELEAQVAALAAQQREALRASEELHRTTLYSIGDAVIATDAEVRVQVMNRVAERLTGWPEVEARGRPLDQVFHIVNEETRAVVESPAAKVLREGQIVGLANHTLLVARDGTERPIADSGAPVLDGQGRTCGVVLVFRDQTGEREVQRALHAALTRQASLLAAVPDIVMEVDENKVYTWANEVGKRFFGDDVVGREAASYFEGEQDTYELVGPLFAGGEQTVYVESWQRRQDGAKRLLAWWCRVLVDESGRVVGALSTARDITEAKLAENELRLRDAAIAASSAGLAISTPEGTLRYVNHALARMHGRDRAELIGKAASSLWPRAGEVLGAVAQRGGWKGEYTLQQGGSELTLQIAVNAVQDAAGRPLGMVGAFLDITDLRRSEQALRAEQARTASILAGIADTFYALDRDWRFVTVNPAAEKAPFGRPAGELLGRVIWELYPGLLGTDIHQHYLDAARHRKLEHYEARSPLNGRWYEVFMQGWEGGVDVYMRDITQRRNTEEALRLSEERLELAIESGDFAVWDWDLRSGAMVWDGRMMELYGIDPDRFPASVEAWVNGLHAEDRESALAVSREALESGRPYDTEFRVQRPDGTVRHVKAHGLVLRADDGTPLRMTGLNRDITGRKQEEAERARLEEQLHHARKMEAIGTLAGGVAHDFNNILGGILGGLSLLELELGDALEGHETDFEDMKALVQRGSDLARQLLGLGRRGKYTVQPLDLALVVHKTSTMFGCTRRDIVITHDFVPDLPPVLMDHTQLEQVLLNLLLNAGQAMPAGGRILLRAEPASVTAERSLTQGVAPGRFVRLVVADTGIGMDAATRERIFEPFFTTKGPGKGTGLGLASVYGILQNHGGSIRVESEPGKGAAFILLLPATDKPVAEVTPTRTPVQVCQGTLLVVDDEEMVLKTCSRLLGAMGYRVHTAQGGREAIELVRRHRGELDLIILDLTMPEMSGARTFEEIRKIDPGVKVLLSSGYSVEGQAQELLDRGCNGFLQKPFDGATLAEKIRSLL